MIVIRNTTVIDVAKCMLCPGQDILVDGGLITDVVPTGCRRTHEIDQVIDGEGRFALPGLWDMHVHWHEREGMSLFPLYGVTGVRVMWGMPDHFEWRAQFNSGEYLGPRMTIASPVVDGPDPLWPESSVVATREEAIEFVRTTVDSDADFLKVYSVLGRSEYLALLKEAQHLSLPVDGHVPITVDVRAASNAGHRCMEHLLEIQIACARAERDIRRRREWLRWQNKNWNQIFDDPILSDWTMRACLESFDEDKARSLFDLFRQNRTWQCPTLTVLRNLAFLNDRTIANAEVEAYIPKSFRAFMCPTDEERTVVRRRIEQDSYQQLVSIIRMMHDQGVRLVAGTDASNPYCYPGASLHTELEILVEAGLTPFDALRAATMNPAKMLASEFNHGSIEKGFVADIVLVRQDPSLDIRHTREIEGVMTRGHWIDRQERLARLAALRDRP